MTISPRRTSARALIALNLLLLIAPAAQAVRLDAISDTWIREMTPQTAYDNDLISVWGTGAETGGVRHGAIMFDLSTFTEQITSAYIELYDRDDNRSRTTTLTQQAFILQTTPPEIDGYTWEEYNAFDKPTEAAFVGLGAYNVPVGDLVNGFEPSQLATPEDLTLLQSVRVSQSGKVVFILKATAGSRDWGDIEFDHTAPRLVLNEPLDLFGDLNVDRNINAADFAILTSPTNWLQAVTPGAPGDLNADGVVNLKDFKLFKPVYLAANPGATLSWSPVPEPTAIALSALASLSLCVAGRRRVAAASARKS